MDIGRSSNLLSYTGLTIQSSMAAAGAGVAGLINGSGSVNTNNGNTNANQKTNNNSNNSQKNTTGLGTPSMSSSASSGYGSQAVSCSNLTNDDTLSLRSMSVDDTPGKD